LLSAPFFEGETILILAGLAAHQGYLSLPEVIAAACLGSFCGEQLFFLFRPQTQSSYFCKTAYLGCKN
jgi:membrane protein DedA with SNARE-associated domain